MPLSKVRTLLDGHHIKYVIISHSKAYMAQGIAAIAHIPGQELGKNHHRSATSRRDHCFMR
jgi:Ala-tRNA(Pro) deacylase